MISGKIEIQLQSATLSRDVKFIGSMNPYVVVQVGDVKKTSATNKKGGKYPKWTDQMEFQKTNETEMILNVYNLRSHHENDLIGTASVSINRFSNQYSAEESASLMYQNKQAGIIKFNITFIPDVQFTIQNGQLIKQGEAPLDVTLKVLSAKLTRDNQLFGKMSSYYVINCGDHKFSSGVCVKGGKNPQWSDQFSFIKSFNQDFSIDIQNQNKNSNIAHCKISHDILSNSFRSGIRTIPLTFEGSQAGDILVEVSFNYVPTFVPQVQQEKYPINYVVASPSPLQPSLQQQTNCYSPFQQQQSPCFTQPQSQTQPPIQPPQAINIRLEVPPVMLQNQQQQYQSGGLYPNLSIQNSKSNQSNTYNATPSNQYQQYQQFSPSQQYPQLNMQQQQQYGQYH